MTILLLDITFIYIRKLDWIQHIETAFDIKGLVRRLRKLCTTVTAVKLRNI